MASSRSPHIAHELLSRAFPSADADRIFSEKVQQKPLFLRPTNPEGLDARESRRRSRKLKVRQLSKGQKPKPLSAREKRALCIYEVPKEAQRYDIYEPLHRMWVGYMQEVLGQGTVNAQSAVKLVSADFHGADIEVVRARSVTRVGLRGIVVKDTKFTFEIITRGNQLKTLPKVHSVFRFEVPQKANETPTEEKRRPLVFELHGSQIQNRATDRANKKFKQRDLEDL
ncbi:MAG: hypothetical protein M1819_003084 [Sarea resinae]|nr:MAG: hypothetical protein M1819_003084 [Sarea resinae]